MLCKIETFNQKYSRFIYTFLGSVDIDKTRSVNILRLKKISLHIDLDERQDMTNIGPSSAIFQMMHMIPQPKMVHRTALMASLRNRHLMSIDWADIQGHFPSNPCNHSSFAQS
jgi:hypothetical protein